MNKNELQIEYDELTTKLSSGSLRGEELITASRRLKELQAELDRLTAKEKREARKQEAEKMLEAETDPELRLLAEEELHVIETEEQKEKEGGGRTLTKEAAIMEIRPGTGGEEASLFAAELARMYIRYAERKSWAVAVVDEIQSDLGGLKSLTLTITGKGAYTALKHEGGIHRVQRIPDTEKSGRIHTSAATVAVLPKVATKDFHVPASELRIDTMRASGPGGQFVNRRESAVRVLHIPTGIIVTSQNERTQNTNREQAMEVLLAKLADLKRQEEIAKTGATRKSQVGSGDRSEKIRTYNYPQDRVTDHRIGKSWYNLKTILDGDIDDIVETLQTAKK